MVVPLSISPERAGYSARVSIDDAPVRRREARAQATGPIALAWVDEQRVATVTTPVVPATTPFVPVAADLLARAPRRSPWRPGVLVPTGLIIALIALYAATTLLWPLHAVAPTVTALTVTPAAAPATAPAWPAQGSAAVAVLGVGEASSSPDAVEIASITKVVTALLVLDQMPLALGESGPEFRFTGADSDDYWAYRRNGESALDVPIGGTLTQYQLLEGMLIGSANNYADRLAYNIWPSDRVFAAAANSWLAAHGVPGVTIVDPSGIEAGNVASPAALIALAERALANPVIAEIVATQSVELPGAGTVTNTNGLLADQGVVGVKTGTLDSWNVLSAKDVEIGDTSVRLYAAVMGQVDDEARLGASRALYAQLEGELQPTTTVASGTVAGTVSTRWGATADIVVDADADVILWNGGVATVDPAYDLGDSRDESDIVGGLTATGPLNEATVNLRLDRDIDPPSPWWRLTHPLDLFGLND